MSKIEEKSVKHH